MPALVPEAVGLSGLAAIILCLKLDCKFDKDFKNFQLPPGRSSVFQGIHNTTLIDSTYNASLDAAIEVINMFAVLNAKTKWLVVSDILEQGQSEQSVHERLAKKITKHKFDKIIVMGPRSLQYLSPVLDKEDIKHVAFENPREVLDYLQAELKGGETVLFKGTRFMEGIIEHLLKNPADASKLCRREGIWVKRRKEWQL